MGAMTAERPRPGHPRTLSRAKAQLLAEAGGWLATGTVARDEREPVDRLLNRLDAVVPVEDHYAWLITPQAELGDRQPMEFIDADDLAPLQALLDRLPDHNGAVFQEDGKSR